MAAWDVVRLSIAPLSFMLKYNKTPIIEIMHGCLCNTRQQLRCALCLFTGIGKKHRTPSTHFVPLMRTYGYYAEFHINTT